jgi:hypothetical protein
MITLSSYSLIIRSAEEAGTPGEKKSILANSQSEHGVIASVVTIASVVLILAAGTAVALSLIQETPTKQAPSAADNRSMASLVAAAPRLNGLGDTVDLHTHGADFRITIANLRVGAENADCSGGTIHLVDVTVENVRGTLFIDPADLSARGDEGGNFASAPTNFDRPLATATLVDAATATGTVGFLVPAGETIVATGFTSGSVVATWAVPAGVGTVAGP